MIFIVLNTMLKKADSKQKGDFHIDDEILVSVSEEVSRRQTFLFY